MVEDLCGGFSKEQGSDCVKNNAGTLNTPEE